MLPHFSFNIRCGDSLLQEIGGINLGQIRADFSGIPRSLKDRVSRLKNEKLKFFNNDPTCRYTKEWKLEKEELDLFRDLLDTQAKDVKQQIDDLQELVDGPRAQQIRLDGTIDESAAHQFELQAAEWREQIETLTVDHDRLIEARGALRNAPTSPFVWDIAFVEIFSDEKGGFDIVIGNPPYVRQENIADPKLPRESITTDNKKAYKAKLARSVYQAFRRFFDYKREKDIRVENPSPAVSHKLDAKSDLYIYFYFHGLSLLNPKGSFCFITSNSWLDVGYGKDLQEFLLKHCHTKQIIDNQSRRSFASADVNTVICLFSAPDETREFGLDKTTRFVMFKTPFEGVLDPIIFEEVEEADERTSMPEHRTFPVPQHKLLESGGEYQTSDRSTAAKYSGDKWGGKYLRAPDIYWTILEKGKDKLVRLGDIAEVRFGIKTGANDFFFLNKEDLSAWNIEDEFLVPAMKNAREADQIVVNSSFFPLYMFRCNRSREDLQGTVALEYINWGESQGFHLRSSCKGRPHWWFLGKPQPAHINCNYQIGYVQHFFVSDNPFFVSNNFQCIHHARGPFSLAASLNSSWTQLWVSIMGRTNFGGGLLKTETYETANIVIPNPDMIGEEHATQVLNAATMLELNDEDRRCLDNLVFDALNLTQGERDGVCEAVVNLVKARLSKAKSLQS